MAAPNIVALPDGNKVDLGENPSPEMIAHVHSVIDEQTKSGAKPAAAAPEPSVGDTIAAKASQYAPEIARTAGPIIGGAVGVLGGPVGIAAGAAAGGAAGDVIAQNIEMSRGQREKYQPWRTVAEAGSDAAFAALPMGDAILRAVALSGTLGVVSSNAISIAEGQGFNDAGQDALAFLTAGGLHAITHYAGVRSQAIKEIAGTPEIEEHVDLLTKPDAPTHGPDGKPTEVPAPMLLDEFGRPVERKASYPGQPEQSGPPDPAAQIVAPVTTGGGDTKVGQTPVKRDTGLSMSSRKSQAKQAVLDTFMEQRRPGIFEVEPVKDIPPLGSVTPGQPLLEPDGGMEDLNRQANDPVHDIPGNGEFDDPSPMTQKGIMRYVGRTKGYFKRLEDDTGFPVYQDYDQISQANRKYQTMNKQISSVAGKALKGTDRGDWQAMIQDAAGGADGASLKPKLRAKMDSLMGAADRALEPFGMTAHDLFSEYMPAMADNNQDVLSQEKFGKFQDAMIQGKVNLETNDLPRMMQQISNMGSFESEAGQVVRDMKAKYSAGLDAPEAVKQAINYYTGVLDGTPDRVSQAIGASITHTASKFGWKVDGDGIANRMVSSQYAAMLAGRPGPVIRRLLHPLQTASAPMGFSWLAEGYRQFLTSAGRSLVESSGVASDSIMNELAASGKTGIGKFVDATVSKFMIPFGSADLASRGPVYLGTRAKILWAAEKYGDDAQKFLTNSGVGRYTSQEANIVLDLLSRGKLDEAADRGAQMMVDNTQFMYSALERPRIFTGAGKSVGAFGVWPAQYGEYLGRMANRGANGTGYEVGRDYARFLTANAAIIGGFYGAGKFLNDKTQLVNSLGWSMISHVVYTGAPLLESLMQGGKQLKDLSEGRKTPASEVFRNVAAPFIPMSGMGMDIMAARKQPTMTTAVGSYSGLARVSPSKGGFKGYGSSKGLKGF
jgi:hypothetical protein